jgi:DNA-binding CsgD family transcriptional regulator
MKLLESYYPEGFFNNNKNLGDLSLLFALPPFKVLQEHSPCAICILNHIHMRYDYFSENIKSLLGYEAERYKQKDGFEFAISTFYPSHAVVFSNQIVPKILEYYTEYSSDEVKKLRFSFTFLCRKNDDEYIWCMQQISVLETDEQGLPLFTLVFMSNVHNVKKDAQLDFIVTQQKEDGSLLPILATTFLDQENMTFLSKRELEVLILISKGLNTPEISNLLFISQDTVSNHRKNMLGKTNTKNTAELLNLAMKKGIL